MSGKLGFVEGNLVVRQPRSINILKGKYISQIYLGEQMTVIATSLSGQISSLQIQIK